MKIFKQCLSQEEEYSQGTKRRKEKGTNNNKINAKYETSDAQAKKNCNIATIFERSLEKLLREGWDT